MHGVPNKVYADVAPIGVSFFPTEEQFALIEIEPGLLQPYMFQEMEIGKLILKVKDMALGSETIIGPGQVPFDDQGVVVVEESGGIAMSDPGAGKFGPAKEFIPGKIRVVGFRRGDGNADGLVDVSDAIVTLSFLFTGGEDVACQDGADTDDNGQLEITDAIALLGNLFLGGGALPAPSQSCGFDPTVDGLRCRVTGCR